MTRYGTYGKDNERTREDATKKRLNSYATTAVIVSNKNSKEGCGTDITISSSMSRLACNQSGTGTPSKEQAVICDKLNSDWKINAQLPLHVTKEPASRESANISASSDEIKASEWNSDLVYLDQNRKDWSINTNGWQRNNPEYIIDEQTAREPTPKRSQCVCGNRWCRDLGLERWAKVRAVPLNKIVSRQSYRNKVILTLGFPEKRLRIKYFRINLHHYPIAMRHLAQKRGDEQFMQANGSYVLPTMTPEEIEEEISIAAKIKRLNSEFYHNNIEDGLLGLRDENLTLTVLKEHLMALERKETTCLGPVNTPEDMLNLGKYRGSGLIDLILAIADVGSRVKTPLDIGEEEYLHKYLNGGAGSKTKKLYNKILDDKQAEQVADIIPHSIASRRTSSRPARRGCRDDLWLKIPTCPSRLARCFVPVNNHMPSTKGNHYADSSYKILGRINISDAESQCTPVGHCSLLKCRDDKRGMNVYVDVDGTMPSLAIDGSKSTTWEHAHYCLVGDVASYNTICRWVEIIAARNLDWLPVAMIFLCRMKGKQVRENEEREILERDVETFAENVDLMESIKEFELFFERLALSMLKKWHMLSLGDLSRLPWGHWNFWRTCLESKLFFAEHIKMRHETRSLASGITKRQALVNMFHDYITILLHTQGMRDALAFRLYTQLAAKIPNNETALDLLRGNSFYDVYFDLAENIFHRYGQGSLRAEAEIVKIMCLALYEVEDDPLRMSDIYLGLYQFKSKKWFIVQNEMGRIIGGDNPTCRATGHDRHVRTFAKLFNPFPDEHLEKFTRILCKLVDDWIRWNFNEFVGQLEQCLQAKKDSSQHMFAIAVLGELVMDYPQYKRHVMSLVKKGQWTEIVNAINTLSSVNKNVESS